MPERRTLTILFASLSGLPASDPEDLRDTLDPLLTRFRARVESRGGTVDKLVGPTLMAVFGAPAVAEPSLRAVQAAFLLRSETALFNRERTLTLELRVGINAGEVVWGSVVGTSPTALGDAVNVAQRLGAAARAGAVVVAEAVEQETRRRVRYGAGAELELKGRQGAVRVFEAEEETGAEEEVALAGRGAEVEALAEAIGRGESATVTGADGMGKTRLLAEMARRAAGAWVAWGRGVECAGPMSPWADLVRAEASDGSALEPQLRAAGETVQEAENGAHLILMSLGRPVRGARVQGIEPARRGAEVVHAWARWLGARAGARRGLVLLDDFQAAGEEARRLFEELSRRMAGRVSFVAAVSPPVKPPASGLEIALGPLSRDATLELVTSVLGLPPSPALASWIATHAEGLPLAAIELVRGLRNRGRLAGAPPDLVSPAEPVPPGALLLPRLDALASEHREVLKSASVLGRSVWPGLVAHLAGPAAPAALAEATARGLLLPQPASSLPGDSELQFGHPLLREAALSLLPRKERARLHEAAASALQALPSRTARSLAASQWKEIGRSDLADPLLIDVAREALEAGAPAEALERARQAAGPVPALLAATALRALGRFHDALAEAEKAAVSLPEARLEVARICDRVGPFVRALEEIEAVLATDLPPRLADEARTLRVQALTSLGRYGEATLANEEARALLGPDSRDLEADLLDAAARVHFRTGDPARALESSEAAIAIRREVGDRAGIATSLKNSGNAHASLGDFDSALAAYAETLTLCRSMGDRGGAAAAQNNIGNLLLQRGDLDPARKIHEEVLRFHKESGDAYGVALSLTNLGLIEQLSGNMAGARAAFEEALATRAGMGDRHGVASSQCRLGHVLLRQGDFAGAERLARESLAVFREVNDPGGAAMSLQTAARAAAELGRKEEGVKLAEEALRIYERAGKEADIADGRKLVESLKS